jgi:hypothetical protein
VVSGTPLAWTFDHGRKLDLLTVTKIGGDAAVMTGNDAGDVPEIEGAVITTGIPPELPPDGGGEWTVMAEFPGVARRLAGTAAWR